MNAGCSIRPTHTADRDAVQDVVRDAFSTEGRDGREEVDIVRNTWAREAAAPGLDLVAVEAGQVTGHVLGAYGRLDEHVLVGVAPLAVAPHRQCEGIGTALMNEVLCRAEESGEPLVVLLGLPAFYGRFGFEPAGPLGIEYPPAGPGSPHFLLRRFPNYEPVYRGVFRYCWELSSG
jgi:putative acetyltransferase